MVRNMNRAGYVGTRVTHLMGTRVNQLLVIGLLILLQAGGAAR